MTGVPDAKGGAGNDTNLYKAFPKADSCKGSARRMLCVYVCKFAKDLIKRSPREKIPPGWFCLLSRAASMLTNTRFEFNVSAVRFLFDRPSSLINSFVDYEYISGFKKKRKKKTGTKSSPILIIT